MTTAFRGDSEIGDTLTGELLTGAIQQELSNRPIDAVDTTKAEATLTDDERKQMAVLSRRLVEPRVPSNSLSDLQVDPERGLSSEEAAARLVAAGRNELARGQPTPLWKVVLLQFGNALILLLIAAAVVALALGDFASGIAILVTVVLNAFVTVYSERRASHALASLGQLTQPHAQVVRDGKLQLISSADVVPGDMLRLNAGDLVAADGLIVRSAGLKVVEALLTGESNEVVKSSQPQPADQQQQTEQAEQQLTPSNAVFAGSSVSAGTAVVMVVATGQNTRLGKVAQLLQGSPRKNGKRRVGQAQTPLQKAVHRLGLLIGVVAVLVSAALFGISLAWGRPDPNHPNQPIWLASLTIAVTLAVSAAPEALPLVVTICFALGAQRLAQKAVLIRKLPVVEALGAVRVICTDKTGTITEGRMTAVQLFAGFREWTVTGKGLAAQGSFIDEDGNDASTLHRRGQTDHSVFTTLLLAAVCSSGSVTESTSRSRAELEAVGSPTDVALMVAAHKIGWTQSQLKQRYPRLLEIPFSSARKLSLCVIDVSSSLPTAVPVQSGLASSFGLGLGFDEKEHKRDSGSPVPLFGFLPLPSNAQGVVCVQGSPDYLLPLCKFALLPNGQVCLIGAAERRELMAALNGFSSRALRVIACAFAVLQSLPFDPKQPDLDLDAAFRMLTGQPDVAQSPDVLVFSGLIGVLDPEREGVKQAIATARNAGIRVVMITGDYVKTGVAIARNVGIALPGSDAEGESVDCSRLRPEGEYLTDAMIDDITATTQVFARATPEDKLAIVSSFIRQQLVVAMTGDGVNDAPGNQSDMESLFDPWVPALKRADIGISMGRAGTEVARQASDMILVDDSFPAIVRAVEEGRTIFENVQRFVIFFLGTNSAQALLIVACVAAGLPLPLEPLQILFLNLAIDGVAAVCLSTEPGSEHIMNQPPRSKQARLLDSNKALLVVFHCIGLLLVTLGAFLLGLWLSIGAVAHPSQLPSSGTLSHHLPLSTAQTLVFVTIAFTENLRMFTLRSFRTWFVSGLVSNRYILLGSAVSLAMTLIVSLVPPAQQLFSLVPLSWRLWLLCVGLALLTMVIDELAKASICAREETRNRWAHMETGVSDVLLELRALRAHVLELQQTQAAQVDAVRQLTGPRPQPQRVCQSLPST